MISKNKLWFLKKQHHLDLKIIFKMIIVRIIILKIEIIYLN